MMYPNGNEALKDVNLTIRQGEFVFIVGRSGAGKTTLTKLLMCEERVSSGRLHIGPYKLEKLPRRRIPYLRRKMGVVFQDFRLFDNRTAYENIAFALRVTGESKKLIEKRVPYFLNVVGLRSKADSYPTELSGGEKQKAALSCLYVMESRCILLDESFANLDHEAAAQLLEMLLRMKTSGRTILAIDHKADLWLEAADEIILLEEGGKVAARGIHCKNLPEHRADFERLGLFYPGSRPERAARPVAEGKPLLQFRGVSIRKGLPTRRKWGRTVYDAPFLVQNADADFPAGCMTAVLGPSGTGKTTTFLSVLKQHPYTGRILFQGRDIAKMKPKELYRHIGIVFQNPANQFVTQNVEDEVCVGLRLWEPGLSDEACRQRAEELLDRYGLKRQRRYSPYMLSQGQQRRLAVLSVLAGGQELLLLDEPTYGQDARSVNAIMEHLREKVEQEGLTVIFITHDTELAAAWADQIYRLEDTALVEKSAEEVL